MQGDLRSRRAAKQHDPRRIDVELDSTTSHVSDCGAHILRRCGKRRLGRQPIDNVRNGKTATGEVAIHRDEVPVVAAVPGASVDHDN